MTTARLVDSGPPITIGDRPHSQVIRRTFSKTVTLAQRRDGNVSTVTATTNLTGNIWYHWYVDGVFRARTTSAQFTFIIASGQQSRIDCIPSNDPGFDAVAHEPDIPAAVVTLWWIRSTDTDVKEYNVEQQKDGGDWSTIATIPYQPSTWDYRIDSPRLDDLADYAWRVSPVDVAGNEGTVVTLDARTIVRVPNSPDFDIAFNEGTTKVTFSEAA